ncbi:hypothetical protein ACH5RR_005674 [Cinchona calisaya]|uniref:Clp R domain-containing protein n=1 Tax=Cinchona calisaya TaxID=153742 RepID=A0ABD3ALV4_9GENT
MRAGGCTVQQALTVEAATIVKQALALARRRGHAQVTPLHVANTMLSTSNGLLRTSCLQSHSHPLQCKALELCFNVALNRLPASSSGPMLGAAHSQYPTISNALVAAFKRAQAHQRRGSIENQQQPLLAVKIELEQLIISILDDPSVSRVMREAGFSSIQVKSNVEQAVSLELCSSQSTQAAAPLFRNNKSKENNNPFVVKVGKTSTSSDIPVKDEDVAFVLESLMNKRRKSFVIVGECLASLEGVVGRIMDKIEKGDHVIEGLKGVKFINIPLNTFGNLHREEVEQKIGELTCLVRSLLGKGVVLYLGDLKWVTDYRASSGEQGRSYYCPVEHMIMEFGRLLCGIGENGKCWLMGVATFQTYTRCRSGHHSLETHWGLHPITLPAGNLSLSLNTESTGASESESRCKKAEKGSYQPLLWSMEERQLTCFADGSEKFEAEVRSIQKNISNNDASMSSLPSWLKDESKRLENNDQNFAPVKWNSMCSSVHKQINSLERTLTLSSSSSPSSSTSFFSYDHQQNIDLHDSPSQLFELRPSFGDPKQAVSPITTSTPNSASSSDIMEMEYIPRFKEFNAENLNILCNALEQKVPWQRAVVPDIAGTILQCRSGMLRRKEIKIIGHHEVKEETWLFFQGVDVQAKEKIARELAKVVFGSYSNFLSIPLSTFSSSRTDDSTDQDLRNKRSRNEQNCIARLAQAISLNPHRVFLVEDLEQADFCSQMGIKRAIERGRITNDSSGEEVSLGDAIIILSCESFSSRSRACSPPIKQKLDGLLKEEKRATIEENTSPCISLDLNISFDDDKVEEDQSIDDLGILENVDRRIVFKLLEL